jgi:type VI secretion system protein ImpG
MTLKNYYEKELTKLHEEANLFSLEFPEHAAALNLEKSKATDPNVQRLLEGCAFLSARIHQMVDEEADHLPEQLIQRLWPQLAEGFPSVCIAQAKPLPGLQKSMILPEGTVLQTGLLGDENTACQFLTTSSLSIHPISVSGFTLDHTAGEALTFSFEANGLLSWDQFDLDTITLYIDTPRIKACGILHLLLSPTSHVKIYADGRMCKSAELRFSSAALSPDRLLNPNAESGLNAQQLVFEAFAFPEKMQCLTLAGLDLCDIPVNTKIVSIEVFNTKVFNSSFSVSKEDIKLFAVPCINRFEHDCEPILLDHKHHRYALTADHAKPQSMQILSLISVEGMTEVNHLPVHYESLNRVTDYNQPNYTLKTQAINTEISQVYISFNSIKIQKESISVRAKVSNGHTPRRFIRPGTLRLADRQSASLLEMTNLHQPTAYLPQESAKLTHYLLQQLRVQVEQIRSAEHLKSLLSLLNRSKSPQFEKRIASIKALHVQARSMIKRGIFYQVQAFRLDLDETGFTSGSDCFLFGLLIHSFFQASAELATIIETTLICHPSEEEFKWLG